MQFTHFTHLGLRVMARLAAQDADDGRIDTRTISDELAASYAHVAKVITRLGEIGAVDARRGRRGGLMITDDGRAAPLGWLVRHLEGDDELLPSCPDRAPETVAQRLQVGMRAAQLALYSSLDTITVADLVPNRAQVIPLAV
ncbi:Rrf2 family transcriptional regulator [Rhodococcus sp. HNM0569]|uniref:RrF2 family transcriptional regulator n=1 Tax=Rhodococcus sp. HNM0569 TaxID=2716340 RepID=UPI00146E18E3|nr:Rrf2 family transcriptional regulator [Rhodococcus sp. HNM0569]NLU82525.1 transcriptional regulator [Rhodococcus sp. HNM0569]